MDADRKEKGSFKLSNDILNEGGNGDSELEMREEQYSSNMNKMKNSYLKNNQMNPVSYDKDGNGVSFDSTDPLKNIGYGNKTNRSSLPNINESQPNIGFIAGNLSDLMSPPQSPKNE